MSTDTESPESLTQDLESLRQENRHLRMELDALRGDYSARTQEQDDELRVSKQSETETQKELEKLHSELRRAVRALKELKAQNLDLQYHLNAWGIPVSSGASEALLMSEKTRGRFFSPIVPLEAGVDPAPTILRGDLRVMHLANLLGFLGQIGFVGVLTVVCDGLVSKLFVEGGSLRLVAWNLRDSDFSLPTLLVESELLSQDDAAVYEEENLFDLEVANRLLYEGRLDEETLRAGLKEHTMVILTQLFQLDQGAFFFQEGRPSCEASLQFELSIPDLLLRTATSMDEDSREFVDEEGDAFEDELTDYDGVEELQDP